MLGNRCQTLLLSGSRIKQLKIRFFPSMSRSFSATKPFSRWFRFFVLVITVLWMFVGREQKYSAGGALVIFAFTDGAGGRWGTETCRRALKIQYSSLAKSQSKHPHLIVYTDDSDTVPEHTFPGLKTNITTIIITPGDLPRIEYREFLTIGRGCHHNPLNTKVVERTNEGNFNGVSFVTFAFTDGAGGRWGTETCRRALKLQYSSLAKSQSEYPHLIVYTDDSDIVPEHTFSGLKTNITTIIITPGDLPRNAFLAIDLWRSLSRSKLDVVEIIARKTEQNIIWIDLDTLVFTDLMEITNTHSWVLGYQHGSCNNCSAEHKLNNGFFDRNIDAAFDAHGDLWALNFSAIEAIRAYENRHLSNFLPLPLYDLQGFFTLMLQDSALPVELVHTLLNSSFGFACSEFDHPTSSNMRLRIRENELTCPVGDLTGVYSEKVGALSFTAPSFQELFLQNDFLELCWIPDHPTRMWLFSWFLKPP